MPDYHELQKQGLSGYHIGRLLLTELQKDTENDTDISGQQDESKIRNTKKGVIIYENSSWHPHI